MSEVRGRSWEDPMPEGRWPRGVTPIRRQGQWLRMPGCDGTGTAKRSYPASEARGGSQEEPPRVRGQRRRPRGATAHPRPGAAPEAKGSSRKEQPHARGQGSDREQQPHAQG